jgi:hypothetical protein
MPLVQNAKLLADSVEALVGAFWVGSSERAALALLRCMGIVQSAEGLPITPLAEGEGPTNCSAVENTLG